jgi:hypothetical protein
MSSNDFQITPKMQENLSLDPYKWLNFYKKRIIDVNSNFIKT